MQLDEFTDEKKKKKICKKKNHYNLYFLENLAIANSD